MQSPEQASPRDNGKLPLDKRPRERRWLFWVIGAFATLVSGLLIAFAIWVFHLNHEIAERFAQKKFAPPIEFYSAPELIRTGYSIQPNELQLVFTRRGYRKREFGQPLQPFDYSVWPGDGCQSLLPEHREPDGENGEGVIGSSPDICVAFRHATGGRNEESEVAGLLQIVAFKKIGSMPTSPFEVIGTFRGTNPQPSESAILIPEIFAQYYGDRPILRTEVSLSQVPPHCKNALLAIEDPSFLEHPGFSLMAFIRAVAANLRYGRFAQGGSTITQQLVKNYFLTEEKTISRKLTEIVMAFLVERHASKEDILETYINLIYMGQNGPFAVRGFAAAAQFYYAKQIESLSLAECSLLAAVLNSPGLNNPFTKPEHALKRRNRVLGKMFELGQISKAEYDTALSTELPHSPVRPLSEPAPYFVKAVRQEVERLGFSPSAGLRVFTTLDLRTQEAAQRAVHEGLITLETKYSRLKKLKESGKNLEALLISTDPSSGYITSIVGGRSYTATQYNRATDSRRQVGSVMKPFVYLTALEQTSKGEASYFPESEIDDSPYTVKYEGQTWTPRNYGGKFFGPVPFWFGLVESLNVPTARIGQDVGIKNVIGLARRMGITSQLKPLPSLALGAFEISPMEVAEAYTTIARLGSHIPISTIHKIEDLAGNELWSFQPSSDDAVNSTDSATLVGILENVIDHGTARTARAIGFKDTAGGKTGTTNDKKDAWFAGFTPQQVAIVWTGYDDNTPHGLTGSSGAVPIWAKFMIYAKKTSDKAAQDIDFPWPPTVQKKLITSDDLEKFPEVIELTSPPITLIEPSSQAPSTE